jgi:hypothetical protein
MIHDSLKVKGNLKIDIFDENQTLKDQRDLKNLVVAVGKDYIANRMASNVTVVMSDMAVGGANVAPTTSDTLLGAEIDRVTLDSTTVTNNTLVYVATFPAGTGTGSLTEAGIFNNPSANSGTMLCRTRFDVVNKAAADTIVITWNVTVE